ncbi:vWA domain-containing protein [Acidisphaera rubrifaciens]|uniref:VWFA domain-containing protein n=1 Tax=Acidisphaera rubrifaciens HS-AP3 TaxID=1231350 RepID=A0A0D6P4N1_9PROT|nr:VWA domain-containing protein [Acidisphaera rubrifaciens]GAN76148.1 hypothetical protein Asru_0063_05 [Acidisphaera rubrifaciens HS-AP3]
MTDRDQPPAIRLHLAAGLDRALAWDGGGSVRYLVAELTAEGAPAGAAPVRAAPPALNLALAIDVSGSMRGPKIAAARDAALALAAALTPRDRLSIVTFDSHTRLLLDARAMDEAGRAAARTAIAGIAAGGQTNLFDGWLLAAERVACAMDALPDASHRVLLLSDGQANEGLTDRIEIARHAGALLERRVITSALGIGDGYDEDLLGAIVEAGGGNLHDAAEAGEIGEVVLGDLHEGRAILVERVRLRVRVPANLRAEVVGAWGHHALAGLLDIVAGSLLPDQTKRIVIRLHCPSGAAGMPILLGVSAGGAVAEGEAQVEARPVEVALHLAGEAENGPQPRDAARSLAVVEAWQADALGRAVQMNRDGDTQAARRWLDSEGEWLASYARGVPGAAPLLAEFELMRARIVRRLDARVTKDVSLFLRKRLRSERELRHAAAPSLAERLAPRPGRR